MVKIVASTVKTAEDTVRDLKNWLAVFKTEYDVPEEVMKTLNEKFEEITKKTGNISCKIEGEEVEADEEQQKDVEELIRDVKNWIAVFKTEYEQKMTDEVRKILFEKLEDLAVKIGDIKCKP